MHTTTPITIQLTASGVEAYCRDLARRSPTPEKRVSAIDAVITFVLSQADAGEQAKDEFVAIRQILLDHFEQARAALLEERARLLRQALEARKLSSIASLYVSLSRDAFWTLLERVAPQLDAAAMNSLRAWASDWLTQTRQRAEQASSYPDAIDFRAAGIDVSEYSAMTDLCRYLGVDS